MMEMTSTHYWLTSGRRQKAGLIIKVANFEIITNNVDVLQKFRNIAPDIKHVKHVKPASAILLGACTNIALTKL